MKVATHDGSFHADEAFALATVALAAGPLDIVRSRDPLMLVACDLRVDVGMRHDPATGDFDHHQKGGAGERANGIRYASFGLLWRQYGTALCGGDSAVAARIDWRLVQGVDAHDNGQTLTQALIDGVQPMTVSGVIGALNPHWDEHADDAAMAARFRQAVALAAQILEREITAGAATVRAAHLVRDAIARAEDPRVITLDGAMPWRETVVTEAPEALFVRYRRRDGWALQAVPRQLGEFGNRKDLPVDWAGLADDELAAVTGVPDATFAHGGRFFATASTREGIDALADLALNHRGDGEANGSTGRVR